MDMQRGWIYSAILHIGVALLVIFGLPRLMDDRKLQDQPMIVEMVQIAEKTNPPPSQQPREEPPKPIPPKPVEDKPPPPQARPIPPPPPVPEPPKPQVAEKPPEPLPKPPEPKPEVKPEPKPEAKKEPPPPPKETATPPPQPVAKAPPPKKPPPKRDDFLNQVLKDLTPTPRVAEKADNKTPPPKEAARPRPPAPPSLDQQMTMSEIDAVRAQVRECWIIPAGARDARDLVVTIRATVAPDGRVTSARIDDLSRMGDPFYRAAAESALRAMLNPRCQPLKLPPQKYEQWKDLLLNFNPKDMIG